MPCSHCHQSGHNITTCPNINESERNEIRANRKRKNVPRRKIRIINPNDYPVDVYLTMGNYLRHLRVIDAKSSLEEIVPKNFFMQIHPNMTEELGLLTSPTHGGLYVYPRSDTVGDMFMDIEDRFYHGSLLLGTESLSSYLQSDGRWSYPMCEQYNFNHEAYICEIDHEINQLTFNCELYNNRSIQAKDLKVGEWQKCALKSMFLLECIIKLGGKSNENLEPILDMVQDINIPRHTEKEKEDAGVPSLLTNIV